VGVAAVRWICRRKVVGWVERRALRRGEFRVCADFVPLATDGVGTFRRDAAFCRVGKVRLTMGLVGCLLAR
jgi:hypothetical protein